MLVGEWCCAVCALAGPCSEEAVGCFRRLLELDAGSGPALLGLGVRALEEKKYEDAIKSLSQGERGVNGHDISLGITDRCFLVPRHIYLSLPSVVMHTVL